MTSAALRAPAIDSAWKYDTGAGSTFGTGEIETMTNSTANVFHDGSGHLVLKALHSGSNPRQPAGPRGGWRRKAATFGAPAGGIVRDGSVDPAAQRQHLERCRLLAGVLDAGLDPAHRDGVAGLGRGRHPGGHQRPQLGVRHAALRCEPRRPVQRVHRHRQRRARLLRLPDRLPHLRGADRPLGLARADPLVPGRHQVLHRQRQPGRRATWSKAVDHPFFIIYDLAMGGGFPAAFGGGPNACHGLRRRR